MKTFTMIATATLITIAAFAGPLSHADDAVPSLTVKYGDLNLSTDKGAAMLYSRILTAAREVCPGDDSDRQLRPLHSRLSCTDAAVARAVRQVNRNSLSVLYSAKTGHVVASLTADNVR